MCYEYTQQQTIKSSCSNLYEFFLCTLFSVGYAFCMYSCIIIQDMKCVWTLLILYQDLLHGTGKHGMNTHFF